MTVYWERRGAPGAASQPVAVIGVGQVYRRDDGVGRTVAALLRNRLPWARLASCDGEGAELINLWAGARLAVVIDGVRTPGLQPGRVHRMTSGDPGRFASLGLPAGTAGIPAHLGTAHAVDLGDVVALGRELGRLPALLLVYGIEIHEMSYGLGLSPSVEAAAYTVAHEIEGIAHQHAAMGHLAVTRH